MKFKGSLDSSTLTLSEARKLKQLVNSSGFFDLPAILESDAPGADRFTYTVTVKTEAITHTIEAGEAAIPVSMRPLLDFLASSIRARRK